MKEIVVQPGDVVASDFGAYQHFSIVSDRVCSMGKYMLISASKRTGTVKEEPFDIATNGKRTYTADVKTTLSAREILFNARNQIDKWKYSVTDSNCEHFINWALGLTVTSRQVVAGVSGATAGAMLVATLSENPKMIKILGSAVAIGGDSDLPYESN